MDDKALKLLTEHSVLILSDVIDTPDYTGMVEAVLLMAGKPFSLYCRGDGGGCRDAKALCDLITHHGNVTGLLPGEANSSHGIIWASCARRYVFPYGKLGVHMVAFDSLSTRVDSLTAGQIAADYMRADKDNAAILASASNRQAVWWYEIITRAGSGGTTLFDAQELQEMGMARPIAEYQSMNNMPTETFRFEGGDLIKC